MGDREGLRGLDYRSSGDPRTAATETITDNRGNTIYVPEKYWPSDSAFTYTLASGMEARLIEAEAALQVSSDDGVWLQRLNQLRQTIGLAVTTDPGTASGAAVWTRAGNDLSDRIVFRWRGTVQR